MVIIIVCRKLVNSALNSKHILLSNLKDRRTQADEQGKRMGLKKSNEDFYSTKCQQTPAISIILTSFP